MIKLLPKTRKYTSKLFITGREAGITYQLLQNVTGVKKGPYGVVVPLDARLCELIYWRTKANIGPKAKKWYRGVLAEEKAKGDILLQDDTEINHPNATKLRPYQRVDVQYLTENKRSLLCSEMGLGKTVSAIIAVEESTENHKVLVISPNSLKTWWKTEKQRWTAYPEQFIEVVESKTRKKQLANYQDGWLIANYAQLRAEASKEHITTSSRGWKIVDEKAFRESSVYFNTTWDWVILDEAQAIRNRKTQIAFLTKQLKFKNCIVLTGTPFANDVSELWSLLNLINPKKYTSFWRFFELYVDYTSDEWGSRTIHGVRHPKLLRRELAPRMIRRMKAEVALELPEKLYQTIPLKMLPKQEKHYKDMANKLYIELSETEKLTVVNMISMMTRLRQILSTPANFDLDDDSCKLDAAMDVITGTTERVVVFTAYRKTVTALCNRLDADDIPHTKIWGGLSSEEVSAAEADLNTGDARVLVATLQSGGVGLNLIGATIAVFVDRHYNPEKQSQAEDRLHRLTQTKQVHVIVLHCPETIDDLVQAILNRKIAMNEKVLGKSLLDELERYKK